MKSMCHEARRNSPSVAAGNPTDSCIRTTSRIAPSSTVRNPSSDIRPAAWSARARCRRAGRSRLPTWSPRKGGRSRIVMRSFYLVVGSGGPTRPPFGCTGPGPRLLRDEVHRVGQLDGPLLVVTLQVGELVADVGDDPVAERLDVLAGQRLVLDGRAGRLAGQIRRD